VLLTRLRNVVHIAEKFLMAAGRRHQDMTGVIRADVGEAVNDAPWKYHPGAWAYGLRLIADEVLYLPLDHDKKLIFG